MNGFPTSLVVAAVIAIVGIVCNIKGWNFSNDTKAAVTQCVGLICEAVVGVILWVRSLHKDTERKLKQVASFHQEVGKSLGLAPPKLSLALVVLLSFMTQGCQNLTPAQNVSVAEQGFTAVVAGLNVARAAHKIDDKSWAAITIAVVSGNDFLDVLDAKVASGEITTNQQLLKSAAWLALQEVLNRLTAWQQKATTVDDDRGSTTRPASRNRRVSATQISYLGSGSVRYQLYPRAAAADHRCAA